MENWKLPFVTCGEFSIPVLAALPLVQELSHPCKLALWDWLIEDLLKPKTFLLGPVANFSLVATIQHTNGQTPQSG